MYITKTHVFTHLNKAAGCTVKDFMIKYLGATIHKYKHAPLRMLAPQHRDKIKIGVTRSPFSWYVSYYHYHQDNGRFKGVPFKEYIERHTMNPRPLLSLMGKKVRKKFPKVYPPKTDLPIGSFTLHFINYFNFNSWEIFKGNELIVDHHLDVLMRTETLKQDMIKVFGEKYTSRINGFKKRNKSKHGDFHKYYDQEMIDLIYKREGILMKRLGYEFE